MEQRCGICGSYGVITQTDGTLQCGKCGAIFADEKEYQKALKKLTSKEDKVAQKKAQKEAEKRAEKEAAKIRAKKDRDSLDTAIPYITFSVANRYDDKDKEKFIDIIICRAKDGRPVAEINGKRHFAHGFSVKSVRYDQSTYEYKPSKLIYTGASSGGITMGGVHETKAGYIERNHLTGHYLLVLNVDGDEHYLIGKITFSEEIAPVVKNKTNLSKKVSVIRNIQEMNNKVAEAKKYAYQLSWDYYQTKSYIEGIQAKFFPEKDEANSIVSAVEIAIASKSAGEIYEEALLLYNEGTVSKKKDAIERFRTIASYKDAGKIISEYEAEEKKRLEEEKALKYDQACKYSNSHDVTELMEAVNTFKSLGNYKDSVLRLKGAESNLKNITAKKTKKCLAIGIPVIIALIGIIVLFTLVILPNMTYNKAVSLMEDGQYDEAISKFESLNDAKDSSALIKECTYLKAVSLMTVGDFEEAITVFESLDNYRDSKAQIEKCGEGIKEANYKQGIALMEEEQYDEAIAKFQSLDGAKDTDTLIKECNYLKAVSLMTDNNFEEAITIFKTLDAYKDSRKKIEEAKRMWIKNSNEGDTIWFGSYEQDESVKGKEDIEWLVLDVKEDKILVISKYALDCKKYNENKVSVTWEDCSLRKWLNTNFLKSAFSSYEKAMIPTVNVSAEKNPKYDTNPGKTTQDKVFLLSINEVEKYLSWSSSERAGKPTDYAVANGVSISTGGNFSWWLRSPGFIQTYAANVEHGGEIYCFGKTVDCDHAAVRPAMWINSK